MAPLTVRRPVALRSSRTAGLVLVGPLVLALTASAVPPGGAGAPDAGFGAPGTGSGPTATTGAYVAPVPGDVVRPFDPPEHDWLPGHRGVDLAAAPGDVVGAPAAGVVSFAGPVGGRHVVVVAHPDGLRSSLEPVSGGPPAGTPVRAGEPVGTLDVAPDDPPTGSGRRGAAAAGHCAPGDCLHWGVRRGETYLDPLALLGEAPPIVLLPLG
jgi:murein DD-endopeptidase MepM/ murein hydrolase activator NlpD